MEHVMDSGIRVEAVRIPVGWDLVLDSKPCCAGVGILCMSLTAPGPMEPSPLVIKFVVPCVDISAVWHTAAGTDKGKPPEWARDFTAKATSQAPVVCLHGERGANRFTMAVADALNPVRIRHGIHEETGNYWFTLTFFPEPVSRMEAYETTIRMDTRDVPFHDALSDVSEWWASRPGYEPSPVPDVARQPMYSTWYGFHQELDAARIEEECRIAKSLGCEAVIVDDGWQTMDNKRGYAYCGDWSPDRMPDMAGHVARVHAIGMKYILWYAVPFVGKYSNAYQRFKDKLLDYQEGWAHAGILDPRFPEVREFLITTYERAMSEWDLDGFKLDFVDSFNATPETAALTGDGRDYASVPEAVDRLLTDTMARLRAMKPDVVIEFRQSYIGPLMRKYGNMFRAGDCPNNQNQNRVATLDIRLLAGGTAAHADMMMWHPDETPEGAAMQFIHTLFAVPQVSVMLGKLPETHAAVVAFWLRFWKEHRELLLDGKLEPLHPEFLYPVVLAGNSDRKLAAVYSDCVVDPGTDVGEELILVNGTLGGRIVLDIRSDLGKRRIVTRDCMGGTVREGEVTLGVGLHSIPVPPAGVAHMVR